MTRQRLGSDPAAMRPRTWHVTADVVLAVTGPGTFRGAGFRWSSWDCSARNWTKTVGDTGPDVLGRSADGMTERESRACWGVQFRAKPVDARARVPYSGPPSEEREAAPDLDRRGYPA